MNTLLLTATITPPPGVPDLSRRDPAARLGDYITALRYYLSDSLSGIDNIVFVDNSKTDLTPLKKLACETKTHKQVEFISFDGLDHPPTNGRGYGEFKMLDYVMANSAILKSAGPDDRVWKVTGRYVVTNLSVFIRRAPLSYDLYCNLRRWPRTWVDLFLISWTPKGYDAVFHGVYHELREDVIKTSPEACMWDIIQGSWHKANIVPRYKVQPFVEGIRGSDSSSYAGGSNLLKFYIRSFARRFFPWVWI